MKLAIVGWFCIAVTLFAARGIVAAPPSQGARAGELAGQVSGPAGAPISSVAIAVIAPRGQIKFALSGAGGRFIVSPLRPGRYRVWAWSRGFTLYEANLRIVPGRRQSLDILLRQEPVAQPTGGVPLIAKHEPPIPPSGSNESPEVGSPDSPTPCFATSVAGKCP